MYRKEFFTLSAVAMGVFGLMVAASLMMEGAMQHEARMLAVDSLPGLVNAGEAMSRMNDNWQSVRLLPELPTPATRSNSISSIRANTTEDLWRLYQKSIFDPRDKLLFAQMQDSRSRCRTLALQYFDLVNAQKLAEARQFLNVKLEPSFQQYKSDAASLFQINTDIGEQRAQRIIKLSHWLPWVAGIFCVLIFLFGVLVGLKGAFGSLVFASQLPERPKDMPPRAKSF
jgi:hypothetical protein